MGFGAHAHALVDVVAQNVVRNGGEDCCLRGRGVKNVGEANANCETHGCCMRRISRLNVHVIILLGLRLLQAVAERQTTNHKHHAPKTERKKASANLCSPVSLVNSDIRSEGGARVGARLGEGVGQSEGEQMLAGAQINCTEL